MLGCINEICHIVVDFNLCAFQQRNKKARHQNAYSRGDSVTLRPNSTCTISLMFLFLESLVILDSDHKRGHVFSDKH